MFDWILIKYNIFIKKVNNFVIVIILQFVNVKEFVEKNKIKENDRRK